MAVSICLLVLVAVLSLLEQADATWSQQYGNALSTSHVPLHGESLPFKTGWRLELGNTGKIFSSWTYNGAVSEKGVLFIPISRRDILAPMSIAAIAPNGTLLWKTYMNETTEPGCKYCFDSSNLVYSQALKMIYMACTCNQPHSVYNPTFVMSIHSSNGSLNWKVIPGSTVNLSAKLISLSETQGVLFYFGCLATNDIGSAFSISLKNGSILSHVWRIPFDEPTDQGGGWASKSGTIDGKQAVLVPYYRHQTIVAFSAENVSKQIWVFKVDSVIYGSADYIEVTPGMKNMVYVSANRKDSYVPFTYILGLNAQNGSVVFNHSGYCVKNPEILPMVSTAVVDADGNAYYSCGHCAFSVYPNGSLRWQSGVHPVSEVAASWPPPPPALNDFTKRLYFVTYKNVIVVLSSEDGAERKTIEIPPLHQDYHSPHQPVLVGNNYMYLMTGYDIELTVWGFEQ